MCSIYAYKRKISVAALCEQYDDGDKVKVSIRLVIISVGDLDFLKRVMIFVVSKKVSKFCGFNVSY